MAELKRLWQDGRLVFGGTSEKYRNHYTFHELMDACYKKEWIPHCKETFNGAQSVIAYLGKYTHRIAVSNHRILCMDEKTVTFSVKDYKNGGDWKTFTVSGVEFVCRFLMHVPPKRFVRIRHYGILASRNKKKRITLYRHHMASKASFWEACLPYRNFKYHRKWVPFLQDYDMISSRRKKIESP